MDNVEEIFTKIQPSKSEPIRNEKYKQKNPKLHLWYTKKKKKIPTSKCPGLDGYTGKFYQIFEQN